MDSRTYARPMIVGAILAFPLAVGFTHLSTVDTPALAPLSHFQSLGEASQVFDAYERWQLADAAEAWFDFRRIVYFDVLLGEHRVETQDGAQRILPVDGDIEIGLAFDDGSRTTLAVPAWGEVVAYDDVLVVKLDLTHVSMVLATETLLPFPPGAVVAFGKLEHDLVVRDFTGAELDVDTSECGIGRALIVDGLTAPRLER